MVEPLDAVAPKYRVSPFGRVTEIRTISPVPPDVVTPTWPPHIVEFRWTITTPLPLMYP